MPKTRFRSRPILIAVCVLALGGAALTRGAFAPPQQAGGGASGGNVPRANVPGANVPGAANVQGSNVPRANVPRANLPRTDVPRGDIELIPDSVLRYNLLVTWYGNPHTPKMGVLGEYFGEELAKGLADQAKAYQAVTEKRVQAAYELVAIVAQGTAGADGMWRRRESAKVIDQMLAEARAHHFKLVLDVQVGHSTVQKEVEHLRKYLEEPDVYLALDPEFHMWEGQQPGRVIGHTLADDINYSIDLLDDIIRAKNLPPKVLIVHQFTMNMLPDKDNVKDGRMVDVALDMDGWGDRPLKLATYRMVTRTPLEYLAIKLFYRKDTNILAPAEAVALKPAPAVVIYQ